MLFLRGGTYRRCHRMSTAAPRILSPPTPPLRFTEAALHESNTHLILIPSSYLLRRAGLESDIAYRARYAFQRGEAILQERYRLSGCGGFVLLRTRSDVPDQGSLNYRDYYTSSLHGAAVESLRALRRSLYAETLTILQSRDISTELARRTLPVRTPASRMRFCPGL